MKKNHSLGTAARLLALALAILPASALAFDASRYPSPTLNTPNVDKIIIQGPGSTGDASGLSVTAQGGTTARTNAQRAGDIFNIKDFGAKGDGTTDDSAALNAAIVAANLKTFYSAQHTPQPFCIYLPSGKYSIVTPPSRFQGAGCVMGDGANQTIINLSTAFAGDLFQWAEAWAVYGTSGPKVHGLRINGALTAPAQQNALMFYDRNDNVDLADIDIWNMPGRALAVGILKPTGSAGQAYIRESRMRAVRVFKSGTPSVPAVEFTTQGSNQSDGTNEVSVSQMDIYGSNGTSLAIRNNSEQGVTRGLKFDSLRIEGTENGTTAAPLLQIGDAAQTGPVGLLTFTNLQLLDAYTGYPAALITSGAAAGSGPSRIYMQGVIAGGLPNGQGLRINNGSYVHGIFSQLKANGTKVIVGPSCQGIYLDGFGDETSWSYSIDPSSLAGVTTPVRRVGNPALTGAGNGTTTARGTLAVDAITAPAGSFSGLTLGSGGIAVSGGSVTGVTFTTSGSFTGAVGANPATGLTVPTLTIGAPAAGGTQAVVAPLRMDYSQIPGGAALSGTGYAVNDILTVVGGTVASGSSAFRLKVTAVDGNGKPTSFGIDFFGGYISLPPDVATVTGGTGTGATVRIAFTISTVQVISPGIGYSTPPAVASQPFNTAAGVYTASVGTGTVSTSLPIAAATGALFLDTNGTTLGTSGPSGGPVKTVGAFVDGSGVRQTLTGSAYTVPANTSLVRFTQTGTIASQTVTLPSVRVDGQAIQFVNYAGQITALTFSPAVNGWTNGGTFAPNVGLRIRWDATAAAWYREQ